MAEATTSDDKLDLEIVASPQNSRQASPKPPVRKQRMAKKTTVVPQPDPAPSTITPECQSRLEAPQTSEDLQQSVECASELTTSRSQSESPKCSESPRTRLKALSKDDVGRLKMVEHLQMENGKLRRALESERSALRKLKAQLAQPVSNPNDNALAAALGAAKSANKCMQQKLHILTEADKRKAAELKSQHDAHVLQLQQLEKRARSQTAQLLEELKAKERQLSQYAGRGLARGSRQGSSGSLCTTKASKMGETEQLHVMEGQISRLECELQRRDDIIQSLRNIDTKREKQLDSRQFGKDGILKDTISDADSAVSSGPTSLSPQPSPDLWYQSRESSLRNMEDNLLATFRRQIHELEMALSISKAGHQSAQSRATELEEQLQDLREHADLLEFRCLELEDTSEKKNSIEKITDCDSGWNSPEVCLKNSASPPLRRSDSGYKSPTYRPSSPRGKRILRTPTASVSESSFSSYIDNNNSTNDMETLQIEHEDAVLNEIHDDDDVKDRLRQILIKTSSEDDKSCLEKVLRLLCTLRMSNSSFINDDYVAKYKNNDLEPNKESAKIIATISPYSQKSNHDTIETKSESKKPPFCLLESGIFDEADWESKETQTEWSDFIYHEPEGELETEVQRLNQIREQFEKTGAIIKKKFGNDQINDETSFYEYYPTDTMHYLEKSHREIYEDRITMLENKISIYESSKEAKDKKLAQRLQREINLQSKLMNLEIDYKRLHEKYLILEEEHCELEEAENDTRLHCQLLQTEFDLQSAKLNDIDDERNCAKTEASCYRALVKEYENKSSYLEEQEKELKEKIKVMENAVPALVFWNIWKIIDKYPDFDFKAAYKAKFDSLSLGLDSNECLQPEIEVMFDCLSERNIDTDAIANIEQLQNFSDHEEVLRSKMAAIEKIVLENSLLFKKQEEAAAIRIKALEEELQTLKENSSQISNKSIEKCNDKCKTKIQMLTTKDAEYKEKIKALENREVVLLMTLTQADEMWAGVESKYKLQIKQFEDNELHLKEQINECENEKNKWKSKCNPLEQKICELEECETKLESQLKKQTQENKDLSVKMNALEDQLSIHTIELQQSKESLKNMENKHKNDLMLQKKKVGIVQEELQIQKKQQIDGDEAHNSKMSSIKKQLSKTSKELQELEVTNGELKEEVETLEKEVQNLSQKLAKHQCESEENVKSLLEELVSKSREADKLRKELSDYQKLPSALEELEQINQMMPKIIDGHKKSSNTDETDSISSDDNVPTVVHDRVAANGKPALPKRKPKLDNFKTKQEWLLNKNRSNDKIESTNSVDKMDIVESINENKARQNQIRTVAIIDNPILKQCGPVENSTLSNEEMKNLPWKPKPFQSIVPTVFLQSNIGIVKKNMASDLTSETNTVKSNGFSDTNRIANEIIANNIGVKEPVNHAPYQKQISNKTMGVFVFDRVSKLLTGITQSNTSSDFRSSSPLSQMITN